MNQKEQALKARANAIPLKSVEKPRDGVVLVRGSELTPTPVRWLWQDWLARGKLHILAGEPGQGKTTISLSFAATVTSGGEWPDGSRSEPGNVLIWSGEDDPADTLLPRLEASGAQTDRVYFITGTREAGEMRAFDPASDTLQLQEMCQEIGNVRLIIIDPIVSAVAGDSHKNTETRRALQPLVNLAAANNAALVGITHFSKGGKDGDPTQRVVGSVAFTAVARVVMVAAKAPTDDNEDRRILARSKSNIGPDEGGFEYRIEHTEPRPDILASFIGWGASVAGTARDLLAPPSDDEGGGKAGRLDTAKEFLQELLVTWTPAKVVEAEAEKVAISPATLRRAKDALGVMSQKSLGKWYWCLRDNMRQPLNDYLNISTTLQ